MTQSIPSWIPQLFGVALIVCQTNIFANESAESRIAVTAVELLFVAEESPTKLALQVELDGMPLRTVWETTFTQLFRFCDRDDNGSLDEIESSRLPTSFALRQILWGRFSLQGGTPPTLRELDLDATGLVSRDELSTFYRRAGLGDLLIGIGKAPATDALSDALLRALDRNRDGSVDEAEWQSSTDLIKQLDSNDDGLIGAGELVAKSAYPGAIGSALLRESLPGESVNPIVADLPFIVLPRADHDAESILDLMARFHRIPRWIPEANQIRSILAAPPDVHWTIRSNANDQMINLVCSAGRSLTSIQSALSYASGSTKFILRGDRGKLTAQTVTARRNFEALFNECDANADGTLDRHELLAPRSRAMEQIANFADRDTDGILSHAEFSVWLDLVDHIAKGHLLLTVIDHGRGLFELLDTDYDGALSRREFRVTVERLGEAGCDRQDRFDRSALPRQLRGIISHGHPQTSLGRPVRRGPDWFLAMDRNGDGEISRREFTGPVDVFQKLDSDKDGFLSPEESDAGRR